MKLDNTTENKCLNCGETFSGEFCPKCGQSSSTGRITLRSSYQSFLEALSSMDGAFFRTMGNLLWRPGHLVRDYICGKRVRYVHPVRLLSSLVAVYLFVIFIFGIAPGEVNILGGDVMTEHVHSDSLASAIYLLSSFLSNKVVSSLLSAFICLLPFTLVFRRSTVAAADGTRQHLNIAEQFCALVYASCLKFSISVVLKLAENIGLNHGTATLIDTVLFLIIPIILYKQLLGSKWWSSIWRCSLALLLTLVGVSLVIIFTFGIFYGIDAVS